MNVTRKPNIGIIGGAGPDAAIHFHTKLLKAMKNILNAKKDIEHYRVLLDNNSQINESFTYSNTGHIFPQGYIESALLLKRMGANIITIPCNSAHIYYKNIKREISSVILVNMIEETCHYLSHYCTDSSTLIGLLAINETLNSKIYETSLKRWGLKVVTPEMKVQENIMQVIAAIKAGIYNEPFIVSYPAHVKIPVELRQISIVDESSPNNNNKHISSPVVLLNQAIEHLRDKGAQYIILGCSELSILAAAIHSTYNNIIVDPIDILAEKTISIAQKISRV